MGRLEDLYKTTEELKETRNTQLQKEVTEEEITNILSMKHSAPGYAQAVFDILDRISAQGVKNSQQKLFIKQMTIHTMQNIRNYADPYLKKRPNKKVPQGSFTISNYRNDPDAKRRVQGSPRH